MTDEHPALTVLRLLVQQHNGKQFLTTEEQHAWFLARHLVAEADKK
jgi:hypothetical protein